MNAAQLLGVVVFGEPRPFFQAAADILAPYPNRSYLNVARDGHDYVWDLPGHIEPAFPYVHGGECSVNPRGPIAVSVDPPPGDPWGLFRFHHTYLYRAGLLKLNPLPVTAVAGQTGITDLDVIDHVDALYQHSGSIQVSWDHYDDGSDDGVVWAAKRMNGFWLVVNRGSVTEQDFCRDLYALPRAVRDLGCVHAGFYIGAPEQHEEIRALIGTDPVIFSGHSLGAARAQDQAALWAAAQARPTFVARAAVTGAAKHLISHR